MNLVLPRSEKGDDPRRRHAQPAFISRKRIAARASAAFARFGSQDHEACVR